MRFINYIINLNKLNSRMLGISLPNEVLLNIDKDRGAHTKVSIFVEIDKNSVQDK